MTLPDFRQYYKATIIKTACGTGTETDMDQWLNGHDREPRNKPTHLQSANLQQRRQEYTMEKRVSSASGVGKAGQLHVNQ